MIKSRLTFGAGRRGKVLKATVLALVIVAALAGVALALTLSNADGKWSSAVAYGGTSYSVGCLQWGSSTQWSTNVNTYQDTSTTDENQVRFGGVDNSSDCTPGSSQSGLGFNGTDGPLTFNAGDIFLLGKFTHYNNPVYFSSANNTLGSVNLAVTLNFSDPSGLNPVLNYSVQFHETANDGSCEYGDSTGNGCDDRVTLPATTPNQTFAIDGVQYTLQIVGFVPDADGVCPASPAGATSNVYTTGERQNNHACLYAQIVLPVDSGDAPDYNAQTLGANRGRHTISSTGSYLGIVRGDGENDGQPNATATGDDTAAYDDEDGFVSMDTNWGDGGSVVVSVTRGTVSGTDRACVYAWVDWAGDGFGVGSDSTAQGQRTTAGNGTLTLTFPQDASMPDPGSFPATTFLRLRVKSNSGTCPTLGTTGNLPTGLWTDGEVEDYRLSFMPLAVDLASFTVATAPEGVVLAWETVSETDNAGFNVYRAENAAGPWTQLNATLILAAAPGSSEGHTYAWTDATALPDIAYWYALEDMALDGALTRHAPSALVGAQSEAAPNAVGLAGFRATSSTPGLAGLAAVIVTALAGAGWRLRRKATR